MHFVSYLRACCAGDAEQGVNDEEAAGQDAPEATWGPDPAYASQPATQHATAC